MLKWEIPTPDASAPVKEAKCKLNLGVLDSSGVQIPHPLKMWVVDAMGKPNTHL